MRFLVLGAGAIGTYVGGSLSARGHEVGFVERPAVVQQLARTGLAIHRGSHTRTERDLRLFTSDADALAAASWDVLIFALKSFDTDVAIGQLVDTGLQVPAILSLQNGVDNEAAIADRLGPDKVIAGTVTTSIAKPGVGEVIEETHRGIGVAAGHDLSERLVAALDHAGLGGRSYDRPGSMKWSKLLTNLQGNATSAILDMSVAEIFADKRLYALEMSVLRECLAVMKALGHAPVDLPRTPVRALAAVTRVPRAIAQPLVARLLGDSRGDKMPSLHIDLRSGRGQTEVDWLNGAVVRHGERLGVPTPVNRVLTQTVDALTLGEQPLDAYRKDPEALLRLL